MSFGGKSKSSSSTTQTTTTNQTDRRIGATDNATVINGENGSEQHITVTDQRAFDLANDTLNGAAIAFDKLLDTTKSVTEASANTAESNASGGVNGMLKMGIVGALGYGLIKVMSK